LVNQTKNLQLGMELHESPLIYHPNSSRSVPPAISCRSRNYNKWKLIEMLRLEWSRAICFSKRHDRKLKVLILKPFLDLPGDQKWRLPLNIVQAMNCGVAHVFPCGVLEHWKIMALLRVNRSIRHKLHGAFLRRVFYNKYNQKVMPHCKTPLGHSKMNF
jgi:hypothetical protein